MRKPKGQKVDLWATEMMRNQLKKLLSPAQVLDCTELCGRRCSICPRAPSGAQETCSTPVAPSTKTRMFVTSHQKTMCWEKPRMSIACLNSDSERESQSFSFWHRRKGANNLQGFADLQSILICMATLIYPLRHMQLIPFLLGKHAVGLPVHMRLMIELPFCFCQQLCSLLGLSAFESTPKESPAKARALGNFRGGLLRTTAQLFETDIMHACTAAIPCSQCSPTWDFCYRHLQQTTWITVIVFLAAKPLSPTFTLSIEWVQIAGQYRKQLTLCHKLSATHGHRRQSQSDSCEALVMENPKS